MYSNYVGNECYLQHQVDLECKLVYEQKELLALSYLIAQLRSYYYIFTTDMARILLLHQIAYNKEC